MSDSSVPRIVGSDRPNTERLTLFSQSCSFSIKPGFLRNQPNLLKSRLPIWDRSWELYSPPAGRWKQQNAACDYQRLATEAIRGLSAWLDTRGSRRTFDLYGIAGQLLQQMLNESKVQKAIQKVVKTAILSLNH
jgi:hypothetical protein